ncbi:retrovirus-related pol polyprotein from transposon TNT 1-94 [Tanacetum coccineum]
MKGGGDDNGGKKNGDASGTKTSLKMLWDELANYDQIPTCICSGCECDLTIKLQKKREEEKVHQFLMGLDVKAYGTLRSNVLSTEPLPPLNRVYAMTIQEERVQEATQLKDERDPVILRFTQILESGQLLYLRQKIALLLVPSVTEQVTLQKVVLRSLVIQNGGVIGLRRPNAELENVEDDLKVTAMEAGTGTLSEDQWNMLVNLLNSHKSSNEKLTGPHFEDGDWSGDVAFVENEFPFEIIDEKAHSSDVIINSNHTSEEQLGRGKRQRKPSTRLKDFVAHTAHLSPSAAPPLQSTSSGTPYPIANYVNCDKFSLCHRCCFEAITTESYPNTFVEAINDERWRVAMQKEIEALENNSTWTIIDLPPGKKVIGCKWVYKTKYNSDGTIE